MSIQWFPLLRHDERYKGHVCTYILMCLMALLLWVRVQEKGAKDKRLPELKIPKTQEQNKTNK